MFELAALPDYFGLLLLGLSADKLKLQKKSVCMDNLCQPRDMQAVFEQAFILECSSLQ